MKPFDWVLLSLAILTFVIQVYTAYKFEQIDVESVRKKYEEKFYKAFWRAMTIGCFIPVLVLLWRIWG